jgi:hypothetical protein
MNGVVDFQFYAVGLFSNFASAGECFRQIGHRYFPAVLYPFKSTVNPDSEPELMTNRMVLKTNKRKINVSYARFIVKSNRKPTIANQNTPWQQKQLLNDSTITLYCTINKL